MHLAPAVDLSIVRARCHLVCILAMLVCSGVVLIVFVLTQSLPEWQVLFVSCTSFATAFVALAAWYVSPSGHLRWDGGHWQWSGWGEPGACRLTLHMSWRSGLLVSLRSEGGRLIWLWLDAPPDSSSWNALRRAVICSRNNADLHAHSHQGEGT